MPGAISTRRPARLATVLIALLVVLGQAVAAEPRIVSVSPVRQGDLICCRLVADGLPGEKTALSLQSGLASSIELMLELLNEKDQVVAGHRVTFQLAFDLWEEIFSVRQGGQEHRFDDFAAMQRFLAELPKQPVAPLSVLDPEGRFLVRVGLRMHPIAPSERERVETVIAGERGAGAAAGADGQEVSVGLGQLIRFFYKGRSDRSKTDCEALSRWFGLEDLGDAPD